jgi:hypothetical protein
MKIIEIIGSASYSDEIVQVEGFLMEINDHVYIAPNRDSFDKISESIWITEPGFLDKIMLSNIPASGGGITSYPYDIVAEGKIFKPDNSPFPLALKNITSAYLKREEDVFQVDLGSLHQK